MAVDVSATALATWNHSERCRLRTFTATASAVKAAPPANSAAINRRSRVINSAAPQAPIRIDAAAADRIALLVSGWRCFQTNFWRTITTSGSFNASAQTTAISIASSSQ